MQMAFTEFTMRLFVPQALIRELLAALCFISNADSLQSLRQQKYTVYRKRRSYSCRSLEPGSSCLLLGEPREDAQHVLDVRSQLRAVRRLNCPRFRGSGRLHNQMYSKDAERIHQIYGRQVSAYITSLRDHLVQSN